MIHHLSISAENPQHVAQVLAEILDGQPTRHPFSLDSYIVFTFDEYGTEIEVYPLGPPEMSAQYMAFAQPENLRKYFVFPDSHDSPRG